MNHRNDQFVAIRQGNKQNEEKIKRMSNVKTFSKMQNFGKKNSQRLTIKIEKQDNRAHEDRRREMNSPLVPQNKSMVPQNKQKSVFQIGFQKQLSVTFQE